MSGINESTPNPLLWRATYRPFENFHYGRHNLNMIFLMFIWLSIITTPDTIKTSQHQSFSHWSLICHRVSSFSSDYQNEWNAVDPVQSEHGLQSTNMGKSASTTVSDAEL